MKPLIILDIISFLCCWLDFNFRQEGDHKSIFSKLKIEELFFLRIVGMWEKIVIMLCYNLIFSYKKII